MASPHEIADGLLQGPVRGRGAGLNPGNRFESTRLHVLGEHLDDQLRDAQGNDAGPARVPTQVIPDKTRSLINHITSPDVPFEWSINPYRGCEHGCIYCYARPDHERLGYSCGLDFETRIIAKFDAPKILARELAHPRWKGDPIAMCGDTDCYQPIERELRITRGCLEVMAQCRQPVSIITKNRLVLRDLDLLADMAGHGVARVALSVTTLDPDLAMKMEPRASSPRDRLAAIAGLAAAGVPVMAMVAPIIPGLNDREVPAILKAVAEAGARASGYALVRLPYQVKVLYEDWLRRQFPQRAEHALSLLRQTRDGHLYDARRGQRMRGSGPVAEQIRKVFRLFARKHGLDRSLPPHNPSAFRRAMPNGQMDLFG